MTNEENEAPVLLIRTGPDALTAVTSRDTPTGWSRLAGVALSSLGPLLEGGQVKDTGHLSARTFTMRPEDEAVWDIHRKFETRGYAYGVLVGRDGKFVKNVALKEVTVPPTTSAVGRPPLDPMAVVNAMAMAQLQASIERLTGLVEQVGHDVKEVLSILHREQEADVLAAVEAVDETYRNYLATGRFASVDWDVLAPLGQVLKKQHRQIFGELSTLPKILAFQSISDAKAAGRLDPQRISSLVSLEYFLLRSMTRWTELRLAAKTSRDELQSDDVSLAQQSMTKYVSSAHELLGQIHSIDSSVRERRWWEQLFTNGLVAGHVKDEKVLQEALGRRSAIRSIVGNFKQLPGDLRTTLSSQLPTGEVDELKRSVPQ